MSRGRGLKGRSREDGAVLAVVLGVLLLIAILGLAGLEGSVLELRMAGAQRNHAVAFYAAEAALSEGERFLRTLSEDDLEIFSGNSAGLYEAAGPGAPAWASAVDWSSAAVRLLGNALPAPVSTPPRYLVEYLGPEGDPPIWHRFRITARGYGAGGVFEVTRERVLGLSLP